MPCTLRLDYGLLGLRRRHGQGWGAAWLIIGMRKTHSVYVMISK